ncbi:MAG: phosphoribosylformylglycinamidine cyclo-ligase [Candidatus Poribacteria bacterium]|nr:phosphoribosylformylglycinamidine cyclo-ligase [Candidatus Poribacteria bacterium]
MANKKPLTYADAGVSFDAESKAMQRIKGLLKTTYRSEVMSDVGSFGGLFALGDYQNPILVSSTDSVGTKLMVAFKAMKHDTVGYDIVAHCGNDIVVQGAEPLFFLDYIGIGKMEPTVIEEIVIGLVSGCRDIGCALIGGETAELSGLYTPGEYDLVGTIVGVVEKDALITGDKIQPGDKIIGLKSTGLHTNGYTLARKILFERCNYDIDTYLPELSTTVGEELLKTHKSYVKSILQLRDVCDIKGIAHITGGGLPGNVERILPNNCLARINKQSWDIPPVFKILQREGDVEEAEMYRVFNMGIGIVVVVTHDSIDTAMTSLSESGESAIEIGEIISGNKGVELCPNPS